MSDFILVSNGYQWWANTQTPITSTAEANDAWLSRIYFYGDLQVVRRPLGVITDIFDDELHPGLRVSEGL